MIARGLKFCIKEEEGLCYLFSENKGADQLRGYREADLRLCFRICQKPFFFSQRGSYIYSPIIVICIWNVRVQRTFIAMHKINKQEYLFLSFSY